MKWLEDVNYVDIYGDHRFTLKVYNIAEEFYFRTRDEQSAQSWVLTLRSARDASLENGRMGSNPVGASNGGNSKPSVKEVGGMGLNNLDDWDNNSVGGKQQQQVPQAEENGTHRPSSAPTQTQTQTSPRMTISELRAVAQSAGYDIRGMERQDLERIAALVRNQAANSNGPPPTSSSSPPTQDQEGNAQEEAARKQKEAEELMKQKKEAEMRRAAEMEQRRRHEEEERQRQAEQQAAELRRRQEEAERQRQQQMEEQRRRQEEERRQQEELQRQVEQQAAQIKQRQEEERRKRVAELQASERMRNQEEESRRMQQQQQQQQNQHHQQQQNQHQQQYYQQQQQQAHYQQQQQQQQQHNQQFYQQHAHQGYPPQGFHQQPQQQQPHQQFYNTNAPPPGGFPQQGFQGHAQPNPHQQQRPPPQQQQQQQQQQGGAQPPLKYMEDKGDEAQSAATLKIKRNILIHWALQPPNLNVLRPIDQLITTIHMAMPPAYGVPTHDYFTKFTPISQHEILSGDAMGNHLDENKLKKAVRKVRVFLHPDKLPRDLSGDQSFMARMLWDITSDSWEEFLKHKDELDWIRS
jgi:hypothetical protein